MIGYPQCFHVSRPGNFPAKSRPLSARAAFPAAGHYDAVAGVFRIAIGYVFRYVLAVLATGVIEAAAAILYQLGSASGLAQN